MSKDTAKPTKKSTPKKSEAQKSDVQPQATSNVATPASKKNLIIAAAIVALVVIAGGIYLIFGRGVTTKDYETAHESVKEVRDKYSELNRSVTIASASGGAQQIDKSKLSEWLDNYKKSVDELKGLKALRDSEVKEKYDDFIKKNDGFVTYSQNMIDSIENVNAVSKECSSLRSVTSSSFTNVDTIMSEYDERIKPCTDSLKSLEGSKVQSFSDMAKEFGKLMDEMRDILSQGVDAAKAGNRSEFLSQNTLFIQKSSQLRTASLKFMNTVKSEAKDKDVADEINALGKLVTSKVNQK